MEGAYEFSEVFEIFDALKGFDSGNVGRFFPAEVDDQYGVRLFAADSPVAVGVEIFEYISTKTRVRSRTAVPKDRGISGLLPALAGDGRGGLCKDRQCYDRQ